MLIDLLALTLLSGLTSAALLLCFEKWGWLTWLQINVGRWWLPGWLPVDCLFCLGFHLAWLVAALLTVVLRQPIMLVPLAALPAGAVSRLLTSVILQK